jgi:hypothetical protein
MLEYSWFSITISTTGGVDEAAAAACRGVAAGVLEWGADEGPIEAASAPDRVPLAHAGRTRSATVRRDRAVGCARITDREVVDTLPRR